MNEIRCWNCYTTNLQKQIRKFKFPDRNPFYQCKKCFDSSTDENGELYKTYYNVDANRKTIDWMKSKGWKSFEVVKCI